MEIDCIEPGYYYHIYNRGINKERIFTQEEHYFKFLVLCNKYLPKKVDVLAYCLLPNHFHFLVYIPEHPERIPTPCQGVEAFRHLLNAYAQWFNKKTCRTGGLFCRPYKRKRITDEDYLKQVIYYIHRNPMHHKLVKECTDWMFSSYPTMIGVQPTLLMRDQVLKWFENRENFINYHTMQFEVDGVAMFEK